jgi:sulfoxide reductase heme-binding subunit YedZ
MAFRILIHAVSIVWLSGFYYQALSGQLSGDPVQHLLDFTGIGALNLILLSLIVSPLAQYLRFAQLMRVRKTLGVYAGVYALAHLYTFTAYELQFEWYLLASEIIERPYITVGMLALLILSALLITSLDKIKRLMGTKWQKLHNFVYIAVALGCLHYLWAVKSNVYEPLIYIALTVILLFLRRKKIKNIFK